MTVKKAFSARLIEKKVVAEETLLMKFAPDTEIAPVPGQFLMASVPESRFFLKRPFSVHFYYEDTGYFKILVRLRDNATRELTSLRYGEACDFIGPLGNGFPLKGIEGKVAILAGGIGIAPFAYVLKSLKGRATSIDVYYGERERRFLVEYWRWSGVNTFIATDLGDEGHKGSVLDLFKTGREYDSIFLCGPGKMLEAFMKRYPKLSGRSSASLENYMACGVGACKGCKIKTKSGIKYVCRDGPVFPVSELIVNG